jgi:GNAT superfamily N-acetyltransferase
MPETQPPMEWTRSEFTISCDAQRLDRTVIRDFLGSSYWAAGISDGTIAKSIEHSLCFGLYVAERQIGFARVITDRAVFAYLADVFVLEAYRGAGLGQWLIDCVIRHPELQGLRRWMLGTRDAHRLYERFGFTPLKRPDTFMERHSPSAYRDIAG